MPQRKRKRRKLRRFIKARSAVTPTAPKADCNAKISK
jgi:hypothetical protein